MAIRPLDMQVMVPKLQDVAKINQTQQQKGQVQQDQLSASQQKVTEHEKRSVGGSKEDEKARNQQDAKDEGKGGYYSDPRDKKKQEQDKESAENVPRHKIDIKI